METSAVASTSIAQQQLRQSGQATESIEASRAKPARQQQEPKAEQPRPATNMQGQRTGTVVNTTA